MASLVLSVLTRDPELSALVEASSGASACTDGACLPLPPYCGCWPALQSCRFAAAQFRSSSDLKRALLRMQTADDLRCSLETELRSLDMVARV